MHVLGRAESMSSTVIHPQHGRDGWKYRLWAAQTVTHRSCCHSWYRCCCCAAAADHQVLEELGSTREGRRSIAKAMKLCPTVPLDSLSAVLQLRGWLASAWWVWHECSHVQGKLA